MAPGSFPDRVSCGRRGNNVRGDWSPGEEEGQSAEVCRDRFKTAQGEEERDSTKRQAK